MSSTDYVPAGSLATGIPLFYGPDESSGRVDLPHNRRHALAHTTTTSTGGYIQSWNLTYERRLPWDMSVSAGYVGTKIDAPDRLLQHQRVRRPARGRPASRSSSSAAARPTRARFDGWQSSNYHSLQMALNKPFSKGFFVKAAYTFSKAMNRQDDDGWDNVDWN